MKRQEQHGGAARGSGWWYCRLRRQWYAIYDHAVAVAERPRRFRLDPATVAALVQEHGGSALLETVRAKLIPLTCAHGWLRVRLHRGTLGWQFAGHAAGAHRVLRCFVRRHEVGPMTHVTFSDFAAGKSVTMLLTELLPSVPWPLPVRDLSSMRIDDYTFEAVMDAADLPPAWLVRAAASELGERDGK